MDLVDQQKQIYQQLVEKVRADKDISELTLKNIFSKLSRLPETYKLDFIKVQLPILLTKSLEKRDDILYEHFHNYVSIPCLAALLKVLRESELDFAAPIQLLLEHIRNLQLVPGPDSAERKLLQQLQFDLIDLIQDLSESQCLRVVDLSDAKKQRELAERYYERILSSFISEDDDDLVSEQEFVENLKEEQLRSGSVVSFASEAAPSTDVGRKQYLAKLGGILKETINETYLANYRGIFNGDRDFVLKKFVEAIENRCHDCGDSSRVPLDPITSSVMAVTLELVFNSGLSAFKETLSETIYQEEEEV